MNTETLKAPLPAPEKKVTTLQRKLDIVEKMLEDKSRELYLSRESLQSANSLLKRQTQELERMNSQLGAANKELEAFSYSVSHDLRAPLRTMDGFSQLILEKYPDKMDDQGKHYLERIRAGCTRMSQLIQDMLTLSRLSRCELRYDEVNLSGLAKLVTTELSESDHTRTVEFLITDGLTAYGSKDLLHIVLENLLGNAWKFTSKHPHGKIEFGLMERDGERAYYVRDDGAGFDMAHVEQLFGVFQRLHRATEFSGTGIGLASVQRIIHRHKGRIWAEGEVERGAAFYFTIGEKETK